MRRVHIPKLRNHVIIIIYVSKFKTLYGLLIYIYIKKIKYFTILGEIFHVTLVSQSRNRDKEKNLFRTRESSESNEKHYFNLVTRGFT